MQVIKLPHFRGKGFEKATEDSAAFDLYCSAEKDIYRHELFNPKLIPTGIKIHIDNPGIVGVLSARSSLGHKLDVQLANGIGVIDADYTGELFVSCVSREVELGKSHISDVVIKPGDRIAQIMFVPVMHPEIEYVEEFTSTSERGEGGFGSTGK